MFPKMTKHAKFSAVLGLVGLLFLAGGIYFYQQHTAVTVQERIYVVPEQSKRQAVSPPMAFQRTPVHPTSHSHADEDKHHGDINSAHDYESDTFASSDGSDLFLTETSFPEEPLPAESAPRRIGITNRKFSGGTQ